MPSRPKPAPLNWRTLLRLLAAVAVLELGFFLLRLGASGWNPLP
ncbi:hypothetical protein [Methyloparacoccus murrellii]